MATTSRPLTVVAILLSMFMAAMEATVVATAMPTVVADLGGIELYGWIGAVYMLASTVTMPLYGKLADVMGRKPVMYLGLLLFLAGSMASGLSRTMIQLIAFRAVQGLGAGALQPVGLTMIGDMFSTEERARVQGVFGAVWGFAGIAGPLLGGVIVKALSWHWVFFINVPFGVLSAVILTFAFHERIERRPRTFDAAGAAVMAGAVFALLLGVSGVSTVRTLSLAGGLLALFVFIESRAKEPLLPLSLLRRRIIATSSAAGAVLGALMMGPVMYIPLFVQAVLHGTPTSAGTAVAPMLVGWPIASAGAGKLIARFGFRPLVRAGAIMVAASSVLLAWELVPGANLWLVRTTMFMFGAGLGLANTALLIAVQESVTWEQRGVATASTMFFRTMGGAVAVGALGGVLAASLDGAASHSAVNDLLGPTHGKMLDPTILAQLSTLLERGLHMVFHIIAVLSIVGVVVAFLFPTTSTRPRTS